MTDELDRVNRLRAGRTTEVNVRGAIKLADVMCNVKVSLMTSGKYQETKNLQRAVSLELQKVCS